MITEYAEKVFLKAVYNADNRSAVAALKQGVNVNVIDPAMGLTALHIAVGTNNMTLAQTLVDDWNAEFKADARGRWPTLIAAECRVDERLSDYIVDAEARSLGNYLVPRLQCR